MSKVLGFMKQVAYGLQMEGNFGTAHVYRSYRLSLASVES